MIKIREIYFDTSIKQILETINKETNNEYIKQIKDGHDNFLITCPFHANHNESHPSCGVVNNEDRDDCGIYHCFTCGASGTILDLIAQCFNYDIPSAIYWLQSHYKVILVQQEEFLPEIKLDKETNIQVMDESELLNYQYFHPYMFKRGLTEDIIRKFRIGCTPDGKYITFPFWDEHDNLICLYKRSTVGKEFIIPKNSTKGVYLLNFIIKEHITKVCVCEGLFDALVMWTYGYPAVALCGAGTSKYQMQLLNNSGIRNYILMYDNDPAGRKGAEKFKHLIKNDVFVTDIIMPQGKDCASCTKDEIDNLIKLNS